MNRPEQHRAIAGILLILATLCFPCGGDSTSSEKLPPNKAIQDRFFNHESDFSSLVEMVHQDKDLRMITPKGMLSASSKGQVVAPSDAGFSDARSTQYQMVMNRVGARYLYATSDGSVAFTAEDWAVDGIICAYTWKPKPPAVENIVKDFDEFRQLSSSLGKPAHLDRNVPLKGNWYVVLQTQ